jgi:ROS/MUCR transcriptional regulator protein
LVTAAEDDLPLHGEVGVLAYDPVDDRIQCHVCGRWLHKIESKHLGLHSLAIGEYKELYGLNDKTALETPTITERRRLANQRHEDWRNLRTDWQFQKGHVATRRGSVSPQFRREHYTPRVQQSKARAWTDEGMLTYLRDLQRASGGYLRQEDLTRDRPRGRGFRPSRNAVIKRFGSWQRVCELLGQPYRMGRPRRLGAWSNRRYRYKTLVAAYQAAMRAPAGSDGGHVVQIAGGVVDGVPSDGHFWTDGIIWRAFGEADGAHESTEPQSVPSHWKDLTDI